MSDSSNSKTDDTIKSHSDNKKYYQTIRYCFIAFVVIVIILLIIYAWYFVFSSNKENILSLPKPESSSKEAPVNCKKKGKKNLGDKKYTNDFKSKANKTVA